jgi:hypothetical protein
MSAWLCSETHIAIIASMTTDPPAAFKTLVRENMRSLSARYPGRDFLEDWKKEAKQYRFQAPEAMPDATTIVKQCDCFDYQACETDNYSRTKAAQLVDSVRALAICAGGEESGARYDAAPWGID